MHKDDFWADKDPRAVEGVKIGLDAVDVILQGLLEEIQVQVDALDRRSRTPSVDAGHVGSALRMVVQKQTIEALRRGIPAAILDGDVTKLRGAVG